ncbi:MAG: outer membrane lipoprotein chaperone LolA [Rubrivivax sp.]|nr:outer membrane lipoprotein chaperone LolA [Rubrivivax sp.]
MKRLCLSRRQALRAGLATLAASALQALPAASSAQADATETLRQFLREAQSGKGSFTQTVTAADGVRKKVSSGSFEFLRPNRFRFSYVKPFEQLIVADGSKVWIYDPDLKQASSRRMDAALGSTPAALIAGGNLDKDFVLKADGPRDGLDWVLATPRQREGTVRELRVGLRGREPAAIEILDSFGQRTLLQFSGFQTGVPLARESFVFKPPPGADVIEQ